MEEDGRGVKSRAGPGCDEKWRSAEASKRVRERGMQR